MPRHPVKPGIPFRPDADDLKAIAEDVAEIGDIQGSLLDNHRDLHVPDRVAHQYQIAGGKVKFRVAAVLPPELEGVGLFRPGAEHIGIGRISTGLGTPHLETNPDFLGLMFAFRTGNGDRVDFLGINDPAAPTDNHHEFMAVLHATGESAGAEIPLVGDWGEYDVGNLLAEQKEFGKALLARMGLKAAKTLAHIVKQTARTFHSSTAWQAYWTGIVEVGGTNGKFTLVPTVDENARPRFRPGERHLSDEWKTRQSAGDVEFLLYWIPFLNENETPTGRLTAPWEEGHKRQVGRIAFPQANPDSDEAKAWAALASEMGANPGHWVRDRQNRIGEPATEFETARKMAYRRSQEGRGALDSKWYQSVFETGTIGADLARELNRRRDEKERLGHVSWAP
jgi:hypothetical protein